MRCSIKDIDKVIRLTSPYIEDAKGSDLKEIMEYALCNSEVYVLLPNEDTLCVLFHIGNQEYDVHVIGHGYMEAAKWMFENTGCRELSWVCPNEKIERLSRMLTHKGIIQFESGKYFMEKENVICQQ